MCSNKTTHTFTHPPRDTPIPTIEAFGYSAWILCVTATRSSILVAEYTLAVYMKTKIKLLILDCSMFKSLNANSQ